VRSRSALTSANCDRAGNSPWRAFYRQFGQQFVIGAIGPEADNDPKGFKKAVRAAEERLDEVEED
jgi:hypothetical protein